MSARFHAPDARASGDLVTLPAEETGHLSRVLRLKTGDAIRVFNGRGGEFDAVIEREDRRGALVRVGPPRSAAPESSVAVTFAPAVLKGDKMDDVVRDAVMMGAMAIQPVVSDRAEVTLAALDRGRRRDRWERVAVASAKQCGRAVVPAILVPCTVDDLLEAAGNATRERQVLMFVEPGASSSAARLGELTLAVPREAIVIVGPEGGWSAAEIARASARCRLVTLHGTIIRADAMPTVALSALLTTWGAL